MLSKMMKLLTVVVISLGLIQPLEAGEVSDVLAYSLPNGLKVFLYPDRSKPEFTVNIVYKTGSRHENTDEYGMAHLLEHMLFKGTAQHPEIWKALEARGARFNASTNTDRTSYHETLPEALDNLEFALSLEADRMTGTLLTDDAIRSELSVVKNEWEQSENSAFQPLLKEMLQVAYPHHAYGRDTLGIREGLMGCQPETLRRFYKRRYGPDLASLTVGGAFALDDARRLIEKYFGPLTPLRNEAAEPLMESARPQSERQVVLTRPAPQGYVGIVYRVMKGSDPRFVAAQALVHVLGSGPRSVLQRELVRKGLAQDAFGFVQQSTGEGFIAFIARPAKGQDPLLLAQKMAALIETSASGPFRQEDIQRFQNENSQAWDEMKRDGRAFTMQIGEYEALGDWQLMAAEQDAGKQLKPDDLLQTSRWLVRSNRTIGILDNRQKSAPKPVANGSGSSPLSLHAKPSGIRMFKYP